jgi:hypothetical protein
MMMNMVRRNVRKMIKSQERQIKYKNRKERGNEGNILRDLMPLYGLPRI